LSLVLLAWEGVPANFVAQHSDAEEMGLEGSVHQFFLFLFAESY
jgi:hypothetical protein